MESSAERVFSIQELAHAILSFLDRKDLFHATLVSPLWHTTAHAILWHTLRGEPLNDAATNSLARNGPLVREVTLQQASLGLNWLRSLQTHCLFIQRLHLAGVQSWGGEGRDSEVQVLPFDLPSPQPDSPLQVNGFLSNSIQSIDCYLYLGYMVPCYNVIFRAGAAGYLQGLRSLSFGSMDKGLSNVFTPTTILALLDAFPGLEHLSVFASLDPASTQEALLDHNVNDPIASSESCRQHHGLLSLNLIRVDHPKTLAQILDGLGRLTQLTLYSHQREFQPEFLNVLTTAPCREQLEQVVMSSGESFWTRPGQPQSEGENTPAVILARSQHWRVFVEALPRLQVLSVKGQGISDGALEVFARRASLSALGGQGGFAPIRKIDCSAPTLSYITTPCISALAHSCWALGYIDLQSIADISARELFQQPWACGDRMKVLSLGWVRFNGLEDNVEFRKEIRRMGRLKTLKIAGDGFMLEGLLDLECEQDEDGDGDLRTPPLRRFNLCLRALTVPRLTEQMMSARLARELLKNFPRLRLLGGGITSSLDEEAKAVLQEHNPSILQAPFTFYLG